MKKKPDPLQAYVNRRFSRRTSAYEFEFMSILARSCRLLVFY